MSDDINTSTQREPTSDTPKWTPKVGDWFILKASYCYEENTGCTADSPCEECIKHCNRFVIGGMHHLTDGDAFFFAPVFCNSDGGCYMDSTSCSVLTDNEKVLKEHAPYSASISEAMPIPSPGLSAAKAEKDALLGKIDALEIILQAKYSENAELRKRPTMEEAVTWARSDAWAPPIASDMNEASLAAFIEQRRKEG